MSYQWWDPKLTKFFFNVCASHGPMGRRDLHWYPERQRKGDH